MSFNSELDTSTGMAAESNSQMVITSFGDEPSDSGSSIEDVRKLSANLGYLHLYTGSQKDDEKYLQVILAAKKMGDVPLFSLRNRSVIKDLNLHLNQFYTLVLSANETVVFEGELDSNLLTKFVYATRMGYFLAFSDHVMSNLFKHSIPIIFIFEKEDTQEIEMMIEALKHHFYGYMVAVKISSSRGKAENSLRQYCELEGDRSGLCIVDNEGSLKKYLYKGAINQEGVERYLEKYLTGNLQPYSLSEKLKKVITDNIRV